MKYVEEYLRDVIKIKPLGKLTTKDEQELNGLSGEMVYIDGKCTDIFISHADYANWLEKQQADKTIEHQSSWKPTSLDIKILEDIRDGKVKPLEYGLTLYCLIDRLKELKGE